MQTYIAILRGINVSGHRPVNMKALKALLESEGFTDVTTYIQSGNLVFRHATTAEDMLVAHLEGIIQHKFGFEVPVIVRTATDWKRAAYHNPFLKEKGIDTDKLHITFLAAEPSPENLGKTNTYNYEPDRFIVHGREVYIYAPGGYGNTKLNNTFFESKLKVSATTRNLKTVNKLLELIDFL
ncbi:MAG: DUF1697 domain-containing protein [Chitinophagales bacterium]|nr:DUF1697 domain-containing protein [Chitinophagales bacterium]